MTTIETLTTKQILALQQEAGQSGDYMTVSDCAVALGGYDDSATEEQGKAMMRAARARIVDVIRNAEAQAEDEPSDADRDAANTFARLTVEI